MNKLTGALTLNLLLFLLIACGGSSSDSADSQASAPNSPQNIQLNIGSSAISLGWQEPVNDGSANIFNYQVAVTPSLATTAAVQPSQVTVTGTRAVISGLENNAEYQITISAENSVGVSDPSTIQFATPQFADSSNYSEVSIIGDPGSPSGIYDPDLLRDSEGKLWLSYSSVNYYNDGSGDFVQDVGIRIAKSEDDGTTFNYVTTIASPSPTTVTDSDLAFSACGTQTCTGRWVYETSWMIEDVNSPDPDQRFKLFAHKYFLYPPSSPSTNGRTLYQLGAIVSWTAASPEGTWSAETPLLGWPLSPVELSPPINIATLHPDLQNCIVAAEGAGSVIADTIYLALACPFFDNQTMSVLQKIVMLQSIDHGASYQYVSTLLSPNDATAPVEYFSAPSIIATEDAAPILLATPVVNGIYAGSMAFPFVTEDLSELFIENGKAKSIIFVPVQAPGHIGGASSIARDSNDLGIIQSDATLGATLLDTEFKILSTKVFQEN